MSVDAIVLLFSSLLVLLLGAAALFRRGQGRKNIFFFLLTVSIVLWMVANYGANFVNPLTLLTNRLTFAAIILAVYFLIRFAFLFPDGTDKMSKLLSLSLTTITILVAGVTVLTPYVVGSYIEIQTGTTVTTGPLFVIFLGHFAFMSISALVHLVKERFRLSGESRKQADLILFGITLTLTAGVLMNLIFPLVLDETSLLTYTPYSTIFLIVSISYAIAAHKLFDLKVLAIGFFIFIINVTLFAQLFTYNSVSELVFRIFTQLIVGLGSLLLIQDIRKEIFRREEIEKLAKEKIQTLKELEQRNKNLGTLQRISDIVLQEIELKPMVQKILDEIPMQMDTAVGALVTLVQHGKLEAYTFSANEFSRKITALVGPDLSKYAYPLNKNYNKLHNALLDRVVQESVSLTDFISPPVPKSIAVMLQKLIGAKYCLALPLYVGKENLGVMLFVFKAPKDQLNSKDLEMAQAIANDTTLAIERSQAFQKLKDANEYLSQLDKMKDEFISVASHELNTPLAAIEGYLSMILDEGMGKVDAKSRMYLTRAYDSSKRLAELILDLLNTSRIEQGRLKVKYSKCNLAELAQSVIHELQIKADGKKIYLKLEAPKKVPLIWCDPDRIREVIVNLTGNAIKFTEKGGITIKIEQPNHTLRVSVIDTGRGIDKVDQNKLFQKFSQVKREIDEHQGTGLGLYISKSFVDLHKGRLWVESEAGKGASFIFELPITDGPPKEVPGAILESAFGSPKIEVGSKDAPAIIAASSKKA